MWRLMNSRQLPSRTRFGAGGIPLRFRIRLIVQRPISCETFFIAPLTRV
jgi:hypothetical protein